MFSKPLYLLVFEGQKLNHGYIDTAILIIKYLQSKFFKHSVSQFNKNIQ